LKKQAAAANMKDNSSTRTLAAATAKYEANAKYEAEVQENAKVVVAANPKQQETLCLVKENRRRHEF
jgi:hypothetical protein